MNRLEYSFKCLDGRCIFLCEFDGKSLNYDLESTIDELPNVTGELDEKEAALFSEHIKEANIPAWERKYEPTLSKIEDGISWKVKLHYKDKEYVSEGEESYEPYGYDSFIEALKLCIEKADYFKAGSNE